MKDPTRAPGAAGSPSCARRSLRRSTGPPETAAISCRASRSQSASPGPSGRRTAAAPAADPC